MQSPGLQLLPESRMSCQYWDRGTCHQGMILQGQTLSALFSSLEGREPPPSSLSALGEALGSFVSRKDWGQHKCQLVLSRSKCWDRNWSNRERGRSRAIQKKLVCDALASGVLLAEGHQWLECLASGPPPCLAIAVTVQAPREWQKDLGGGGGFPRGFGQLVSLFLVKTSVAQK